MLFFLTMLGAAFAALRSVRAVPGAPRGPPQLAQSLRAALIGFVVGAAFLSLAYSDMLYVLLALAVGLAKATAPKAPLTQGVRVPRWGYWRF